MSRKNRQRRQQSQQSTALAKPAANQLNPTQTYTLNGQERTVGKSPSGRPVDVSRVPATGLYKPIPHIWFQHPIDLPPFTFATIRAMLMDEGIRLNFKMRAAPISGVKFGWKEGQQWKEGVKCKHPEIAAFIYRQIKRIWTNHIQDIVRAQVWGWSAGEVTIKLSDETGLVEINELLSRHPMDCRLLKVGSERWGVQIQRVESGAVDLPFPYAWFHSYGAEDGEDYGTSAAYGAYSPWADKWFEGGAKDVRRLFMHKDSYGGVDLGYPDGETYVQGYDNPIPNRDIARQIVESIRSGGVTTRPSTRDENGNEKWPLTRATVASNPTHILEYPKDLDAEIRHGMEIPDDVINSGVTGSWDGKSVPMQMFYASLDGWVIAILRDLCKQIIDHLLMLNYGFVPEYETPFMPLGEQAMELQKQNQDDKQDQQHAIPQDSPNFGATTNDSTYGQNDKPITMSVADQIGNGSLDVVSAIEAAKSIFAEQAKENTSKNQVQKPGCVMLECSKEVSYLVRFIQTKLDPASLTEDGCELWPHVTVCYGIQGDDVESVLKFIDKQKPIEVTLGEISTFPKDDGTCVLKIAVQSEALNDFHEQLSKEFNVVSDYDEYQPHITICYCTQDEADKFLGEFIGTGSTMPLYRCKLSMCGGEYYRMLSNEQTEQLIGGTADGLPDSMFDQDSLQQGIQEESEHSTDLDVAKEIAKDHLVEDPNAYTTKKTIVSKVIDFVRGIFS